MRDRPEQRLAGRLLGFARFARSNGFNVGLAEAADCLRAAALCPTLDQALLRRLLRSVFCNNDDDWQRFEALFDAYWLAPNRRVSTRTSVSTNQLQHQLPEKTNTAGQENQQRRSTVGQRPSDVESAAAATSDSSAGAHATLAGASAQASLERSDFRFLSDQQQMRRMERLVERLARRMRCRLARRLRVRRRGRHLHLRRTIHANLRYGGMPFAPIYQHRRTRLPKLLLLLDVSRSMSLYSYLFLRFARGLVGAFTHADAFIYHTRIVHITSALRERDIDRVKQKLALMSAGWAGGTRIGACLSEFNRQYAPRLVSSNTIVIVVSDGLDTGNPETLTTALAQLKRRARRIVWLNPLLGRAGYEPIQTGMQAALPLIDLFAPAHNLASLLALERDLIRL